VKGELAIRISLLASAHGGLQRVTAMGDCNEF